jgi:hypothetical protein
MKNKCAKFVMLLGALTLYLTLALGPLTPAVDASRDSGFRVLCAVDGGGSGGGG